MKITDIQREWAVFVAERAKGIGAVRQVAQNHILVNIEGRGDVRITPNQILSVHDGKVILNAELLQDDLQSAIRHAHDRETR